MKAQETVRCLEQAETGEMRRLRCAACGRHSFRSNQELNRHEALCAEAQRVTDLKSA